MYIEEALASLDLDLHHDKFEVIIVNDGSDDPFTVQKLNAICLPNTFVLHQNNQGLACARNNGIMKARGRYILPLDSDNKIVSTVFLEACEMMERSGTIDMVYTDAYFFGEISRPWRVGSLKPLLLLDKNAIDACCLLRKTSLLEVGMYDADMPGMGNEDWELVLNLLVHNKNIVYLPKTGFHYRVSSSSMSMTTTGARFDQNKRHIYYKHFLPAAIWPVSACCEDRKTLYNFAEPLLVLRECLFNKNLMVFRQRVGFWRTLKAFISKYRLNARYFDRKTRIRNLSLFYPVCKHLGALTMIADATCLIKPVPRQWEQEKRKK